MVCGGYERTGGTKTVGAACSQNRSRGEHGYPRLRLSYRLPDAFFGSAADLTAAPLAGLDEDADILPAFPFDGFSFLGIFQLLPVEPVI